MASEVHQFSATIPAGTLKTSLATVAIGVGNLSIESIDLQVPPGPSGLMGFYLACSGQQFIPYEGGQFLVWDDYQASWDLTDQITTGAWSVVGYNTGAYPHTVYVRFHLNVISPPTVNAPPSLTIVQGVATPSPTPAPTPSQAHVAVGGTPGATPVPSYAYGATPGATPAPTGPPAPVAGGTPAGTPGATGALLAAQFGTQL